MTKADAYYENKEMADHVESSGSSLPVHVLEAANLQSAVIAWTSLDPNVNLRCYFCCKYSDMFVIPCCWAHLLLCSPYIFEETNFKTNVAKSQYWILTNSELKVVTIDDDPVCLLGIFRSQAGVKSIPLRSITDIAIEQKGKGCWNQCKGDVTRIYVRRGLNQEATGFALHDHKVFIDQVLQQRDIAKQYIPSPTAVAQSVVATSNMERGDVEEPIDNVQPMSPTSLPEEVLETTLVRNPVIAWTSVDPDVNLDCHFWSMSFELCVVPCFWPVAILYCPCIFQEATAKINAAKVQYWILTTNELILIVMDHDLNCLPGCSSLGTTVRSIPLENITNVGIDWNRKDQECIHRWTGDVVTVYVDTTNCSHEAVGLALHNHEIFMGHLLSQQDIMKGNKSDTVVEAPNTMERGSTK